MPIVFVHGVNTRKDAAYVDSERVRDQLFRRFALDGVVAEPGQATVVNPYWGGHAAKFAWNHACVPDEKYESFGTQSGVLDSILAEAGPSQQPEPNKFLLETARESFERALDCLWSVAAFTDPSGDDVAAPLAGLGWKAAHYAAANPDPGWLDAVFNDDEFAERLLQEVDKWKPVEKPIAPGNQTVVESFGVSAIWNHIKTAVTNLASAAAASVINPVVQKVRPYVHHRAAVFLGDVFVYLAERGEKGAEGPIVKEVKTALENASAARMPGDDKLLVVAHSMGGNIAYDLLTHYVPGIEVDLFLTVGSQVGLFEELKLFRSSDKAVAAPRLVPIPANVKRWINVLDPSDVLAYSTSKIFAQSEDARFDTGVPVWSAHGMYFYRPTFHKRLAARIVEA